MIIDIVLVISQGRGGLEDVLTKVSNGLIKKRHKVRIFQAYQPIYKEWIETLQEIHFYGINNNLENDNVNDLSLGYKKCMNSMGSPDIIIAAHSPVVSLICQNAISDLYDKKPKIISWIHGEPEYYGGEEWLNYSNSHIAISTDIGKKIKNIVRDNGIVYYVGNPVDTKGLKSITKPKNKMRLLYIGRLENNQKRLDVLFNGLKDLKFDWELDIIGSGEHENQLKDLAKYLKIDKNINWIGWKEDPWSFIQESSALVITSDYEGFGLVMVEALSRGLTVISTDTSGAKDIIIEGINGWIFEKGNSKELANILKEIDTGKRKLPDSNTCKDSIKKFDTDVVVDNIENIILYTYNN